MPEIHSYLDECVAEGQERLFTRPAGVKRWTTIRKRAGLSDITLHDLRRSYASFQASSGTPIATVQKLLSHSSVDTTMKYYISTPDSAAKKSVNALHVAKWLK
jgi:integrase